MEASGSCGNSDRQAQNAINDPHNTKQRRYDGGVEERADGGRADRAPARGDPGGRYRRVFAADRAGGGRHAESAAGTAARADRWRHQGVAGIRTGKHKMRSTISITPNTGVMMAAWRSAPMAGEQIERRLAAILAADIAEYSRLIGRDEEGTLRALRALRRELIDGGIRELREFGQASTKCDQRSA